MSMLNKTSLQRLSTVDKQLQALEFRKLGMTHEEIGQQFGVTKSTAYKWVINAIKETLREPAEEVRQMELERLDAMMKGVWPKAAAGDPNAIYSVLAIMARRAKYLGLDAPDKHEVTGANGGPIEYADASASLLRKLETLANTAQEQGNPILN